MGQRACPHVTPKTALLHRVPYAKRLALEWGYPLGQGHNIGVRRKTKGQRVRADRLRLGAKPRPACTRTKTKGWRWKRTYVKLLAWQAEKAAQLLAETGQITVIVQDNHPIHTSKKAREHWSAWQEKGLFLFQLPKYSSQMNRERN